MGLFDFFNKHKKQKQNKTYAQMLNGYMPIFSQFGQDVYASDVVQQAINCIVLEMKKLKPMHVRSQGGDYIPVKKEIQKLLDHPNSYMSQSDFIEKIYWSLFLNYNAFIIPTYDEIIDINGIKKKKYTALYPIQPINVEFLKNSQNELYVNFRFKNSYETTIKYSDVIHLKYKYSVNDFMGGNESGQPDNNALLKTLTMNNDLLQSVSKAIKSSLSINGVVKYNTMVDADKVDKSIKEFTDKLAKNEAGIVGLDLKYDFIPIRNNAKTIDTETLKFIDEKILRHYGVPLPILLGDYTKEQYEAFYQKTLEPLIISISQAFTNNLFTSTELSFGNQIKFYPHELIFISTEQKINLFNILVDSGSCYQNELRAAFGMEPLPELVGNIAMSSNKTNAENNRTNDASPKGGDNNV